jgi:signal transduction histidine kinase
MLSTADSEVHEREDTLAQFAHDVRNALNAMTAAMAVLELSPPGSGEALEARQVMARQVARLRSIVDERLPVR